MARQPSPPPIPSADRCAAPIRLGEAIAQLAVLVVVGAIVLVQPVMAAPGRPTSWVEAAFTACSAVCGCGLSITNLATRLNVAGQVTLLILIQGGAIIYVLLGARVGAAVFAALDDAVPGAGAAAARPWARPGAVTRAAVIGTLAFELVGALAMAPLWRGDMPLTERAGLSLFHAVSAWCNSGMTILPQGLAPYRYSALSHLVFAPLLVLGGLGVPVLLELWAALQACLVRDGARGAPAVQAAPGAGAGLSRGSRWVLAASAAFYLLGVVTIASAQLVPRLYHALELGNEPNQPTYAPLTPASLGATLADASFLSIASRTGGLSTVPPDEWRPAASWAIMGLMLLGAGLGATTGGIGLIVLVMLLASTRRPADASDAAAPPALLSAALRVAVGMAGLYFLGVFLLCLSEPFPFLSLAFEAASALGDNGLSLGVTGDLTTFGKVVLMVLMAAGRLWPLAVLAMTVKRGSEVIPGSRLSLNG